MCDFRNAVWTLCCRLAVWLVHFPGLFRGQLATFTDVSATANLLLLGGAGPITSWHPHVSVLAQMELYTMTMNSRYKPARVRQSTLWSMIESLQNIQFQSYLLIFIQSHCSHKFWLHDQKKKLRSEQLTALTTHQKYKKKHSSVVNSIY